MRGWLILFLMAFISCSPETAPSNQFAMQNVGQADQVVLEAKQDKIDERFQDVIQYLKSKGFRPHLVDYNTHNIQTAYQPFEETNKEGRIYIRIHVSIKDEKIQFSGQVSGEHFEDVQIRKSKDNILLQQAWQRLVELAVGYSRQNANVNGRNYF